MVKWGRLPSNKNYWIRQNITLEAHGGKTEYRWDEYPFTNTDKYVELVPFRKLASSGLGPRVRFR